VAARDKRRLDVKWIRTATMTVATTMMIMLSSVVHGDGTGDANDSASGELPEGTHPIFKGAQNL